MGDSTMRELSDEDLKGVPRSLWNHIRKRELAEIVKSFTGSEEDIRMLISLSGIVESAEDVKLKNVEKTITGFDDMVEVPAGEFLYGEEKKRLEGREKGGE